MSEIFDGVLTRLPSSDKETEGLEGTFRGIDNLAFQYEVEQGKLGFNQSKMVKNGVRSIRGSKMEERVGSRPRGRDRKDCPP